jgi:hypothetical protein
MPKRTNTFQTVVYMIQRHIAEDATVTESAELVDRTTGEKREVDICIEATIAGHKLCVSLECSAPGRRATVEWVERMHGKHSTLPTSKLVLVSGSGFTPQALKKAQALGIDTVVPENLTEEQAGDIAKRARMVLVKLDLRAETVRVWVAATESEPEEVVETLPDNIVFTDSNEPIFPMIGLVQMLMQQSTDKFGELIAQAADDTEAFAVSADGPQVTIGDPAVRQGLYIEKIAPTLHLRLLTRVLIQGNARITKSDIALHPSRLQETTYSWGESVFDGSPIVVVSTKGADDAITVSIRPLPGGSRTEVHTATAVRAEEEEGGQS